VDINIEALRVTLREAAMNRTFRRGRAETKTAKLRELSRDIAELHRRGATWASIAQILKSAGFEVSADTVRLAVSGPKGTPSKSRSGANGSRERAAVEEKQPPTLNGGTFGAAGIEF
jgi:hypothetical protein